MRTLRAFVTRLQAPLLRARQDHDLALELDAHLQMLTDDNMLAGMSPEESRRMARIALGGMESVKEQCRDRMRFTFLESLLQDLRYAWRGLLNHPGFALTVVLILAFGIGANTAVFSVVNAVLLQPLPYADANRLVALTNPSTLGGESSKDLAVKQVSTTNFEDWQSQSSSFEAMAYYYGWEGPVIAGVAAEYAQVAKVSPEFFRVFRVKPVAGRFFSAEEIKAGAAVAISYAYWQRQFGGDPKVLGRTVRVYGTPMPIVGVLPPGFSFPDSTDLWLPHETTQFMDSRDAQNDLAVGRLKQGVPLRQAQADMTVIARRLELQYPKSNKGRTVAVTRIRDAMVGDARLTLYLLLGAVTMVLLIACANIAALLLGKSMTRAREIAVRVALGAGRGRIVRQLITESLVLSLAAGAGGLVLAWWGSKALVALAPAGLPGLKETGIDSRVLLFTLGVSLLTSLLCGLLPALQVSKVDLNGALKQAATRSVTASGLTRMRGMLVTAEIALAVVLLCGAGLLTKSFVALQNVDLGFRPENVIVMRTTVAAPANEQTRFFKDVLARTAALPGVLAVGAAMALPGHVESSGGYFIDHMPAQPDWNAAPHLTLNVVAPGAFAALGMPLKRGRDFSDGDTVDRPFVAIVNEALLGQALAGQDPIGRTIYCPFDSFKAMTIVGVVGDVRQNGPDVQPMPECYMPFQQHSYNGATLRVIARTAGNPAVLVEAMRRVASERSDVPVTFTTMEALGSENMAAPRFRTLLFGLFAALALCLAVAGVFGITAYAASQRSTEIGLRMAMGANAGSVVRLILGEGLIHAGAGLAVGLTAAIAGTRLLKAVLFDVKPNDPAVYLGVVVLLGMVATVACYIPALRASRVDPMRALRQE
jgi:putative ABC transport system permease protein